MLLATAQASISPTMGFGSRALTRGSLPVAGRPRRFFGCTLIDFAMIWVYLKSRPDGSANFRAGPKPTTWEW